MYKEPVVVTIKMGNKGILTNATATFSGIRKDNVLLGGEKLDYMLEHLNEPLPLLGINWTSDGRIFSLTLSVPLDRIPGQLIVIFVDPDFVYEVII